MDFKENDNHSLSKKDEIQEAVEQLFYNSPFHDILNSFQKLISDQLQNSTISMNIREENEVLHVDIAVPESFQNGDIMIEAKSRYLHVALKEKKKRRFFIIYKPVQNRSAPISRPRRNNEDVVEPKYPHGLISGAKKAWMTFIHAFFIWRIP